MSSFELQFLVCDIPGLGAARPCINVTNLLMCFNSSQYGDPEDSEDNHKRAKANSHSAWERQKLKPNFQHVKKAYLPFTRREGLVLIQFGQLIALINFLKPSPGEG